MIVDGSDFYRFVCRKLKQKAFLYPSKLSIKTMMVNIYKHKNVHFVQIIHA